MLIFNLTRVLSLRAVKYKSAFLRRCGFHRTIASNLANNRAVNIKLSHLETLCWALNCTPNDLFEWQPDEKHVPNENTALKSLIREKDEFVISKIVKDIPLEKLERAKALLTALKDE